MQGRGKRSWNKWTKFSKKNIPSVRYNSFVLSSASDTPVGDLEGLKVSHAFDTLDEGEARILTLKDSRILDNLGVTISFKS